MARKSVVMCELCGKICRSPQGLAGHRRIKHADVPKGVPPPRPVEREFVEKPSVREPVSVPEPVKRESIYKPYPAQLWPVTTQYATQYSPQQQQPQALPPAQPPQPQQPVSAQPLVIKIEAPGTPREEKPLTEADVTRLVEEEILKIPVEAPPKPEVPFSERIRQIFAEHKERKKKWDDEVIKPFKESTRQIHETADELSEKTKKLELSLMKGSEKQKIVPVPSEPPKIVEVVEKPSPPPQQAKAQAEAPSSAQVPRVAEQQTPPPPQRPSEPPAPLVTPRPQPTPAEPPKVQQVEKLPASPTEPPKVQSEISPARAPEAPAEQQAPPPPQPAVPPMSLGDTILMSKRLARESATREVKKLLDAEEARKAGAEKKAEGEGREKVEEEEPQREEGEGEEPQGETLEPPGEEPREEPPEEAPQRRGIFPVFRRRRFRLLR